VCSPHLAAANTCGRSRSMDASPPSGVNRSSPHICIGNRRRDGSDMRPVSLLFHDVYESDPRESGFRSPAADRYKLSLPDFEAQLDGLAELRIPDPRSRIPAVITVDDGGISYYTVIADRLEALGLRAHCFVSTDYICESGFLPPPHNREAA